MSCKGVTDDGRVWHAYRCGEHNVRICDGFTHAQRIQEMMLDKTLPDRMKDQLFVRMVLPDPQKFFDVLGEKQGVKVLSDACYQAFGFDIDNTHEEEKPVIDFEKDASRIDATMLQAYGLSRDEWENMPYKEICELIGLAPYETPMGQALYYRTAERPKETEYNKEELEEFDKLKDFYSLENTNTSTMNEQDMARENDKAAAMWAAFDN